MIDKRKMAYDKKIHNSYFMKEPLAKRNFNIYRSPSHHITTTFFSLYRFGFIIYEVHLLD